MIVTARFTNKATRRNLQADQKSLGKSQEARDHSLSRRLSQASRSGSSTPNSPRRVPNSIHLSVPSFRKGRSGSVPNLRFSSANEWGLKPEQALALKVTWTKLCEAPHSTCRGIGSIMEQVFDRLNEKNKVLREIFYNAAFVDGMAERRGSHTIATLRDHSHFFVSLISQVIQSFDTQSDEILEHINKIGSYHAGLKKYGFRQVLWDRLGEELIDVLVVQDCVRGFPDACRAWTILIATLIDHLQEATASTYASTNVTPPQRRWSCLTGNLSRVSSASIPRRRRQTDGEVQEIKIKPRSRTQTYQRQQSADVQDDAQVDEQLKTNNRTDKK